MTCCEGESAVSTSSPMALALMFSTSCLTTRKLTSASSSAMRISRSAASMFSADSLPSPRRFLKTRCSFSERLSNIEKCQGRKTGARPDTPALGLIFYIIALLRGGFLGRYTDAAGRHLAGPVHAQLVENARTGPKLGRQPFRQPRDVEEDVSAAIVRAQEAKALSVEVSDHRAGLLAGGGFVRFGAFAGRRGLSG